MSSQWGDVCEVGKYLLRGTYLRLRPGVVGRHKLEELVSNLRGADVDTTFFTLFYDEEDNLALFYYGGLWRESYYFDDLINGSRTFL